MFKTIFDEIASALTGRKVIRFEVSSGLPYEVVQFLESVGVVVWPGQARIQEDGNVLCNILVRETQHSYAAGLLAGLPNVLLLDPQGVAPIRPRTSWGKPTRARGVMAGALRAMAGGRGASAKAPPVKTPVNSRQTGRKAMQDDHGMTVLNPPQALFIQSGVRRVSR